MALLLSGGIDSSLILSILAAKGWLDRVQCITGDAGKSEDAAYASRCLEQLGVSGLSLKLDYGEASMAQFLDVCASQAKPFPLIGNVLGMASLYHAISDAGVRVAIDGTGADEIFGGYWYRQVGFAMRDAVLRGDTAWLDAVRSGGMLPSELKGLSNDALAQALPTPVRDLLDDADMALLARHKRQAVAMAPTSDPLVGFSGSFHEALQQDACAGRMQEWLWQNDRNAMAAGVENRSPFLDFRLARFAGSTRRAKFDGQFNKCELRGMFAHFVSLPTSARVDKQGFRWVYGRFLRNNIQEIRALLGTSPLVRHYIEPGKLDQLFANPDQLGQSKLVQRLVVLAGLEQRGCLVGPS